MKIILSFLLFVPLLLASSYSAENYTSKKTETTSHSSNTNSQGIKNNTENQSLPLPKIVSLVEQPPESGDTSNQNNEKNECTQWGWWNKFCSDPVATFTALLFFATVALFVATRQLVKGAEKTASQQLRAYVFPKHDKPMFYNSDGYLTAQIKIKNFGQTPAYDLMSSLSVVMDKFPLVPKAIQPFSPMASKVPLAPNEDLAQTVSLSYHLSQSEIDNIKSGKVAIFVLLVLYYIDIFKERHHTNICLYSTEKYFDILTLAYYSEGSHEDKKNS